VTIHEFVEPDRFVTGTVGPVGQRTFFLQARQSARLVSVALEKTQVAALAERMDELLDTLVRRSGGDLPIPAVPPADEADLGPLDTPIEEEFRVSGLSLMWDEEIDRIVVEARSDEDEENTSADVFRVVLTGAAARAFAARAATVVAAGRPPCPLCTLPLDPEGHICPRQNGHRRHA
jgi:uncharacterized repeat protein (TIGR03847 family)